MLGTSFPEVLERTRTGDASAFAAIWREFQPPLLRYLRVTAREAAEDVGVGDVDDGVHDHLVLRRRRDRLPRLALHGRPSTRDRPLPTGGTPTVGARRPRRARPHPLAASAPEPQDAALSTLALFESALDLIAELPTAQREAVMLRAIAGLDVPHVAAIMGKRPGTVRVLAHRGLRTLARRLTEEERAVTP